MILFVFEGAKREPDLFRAIETLFFQDKETVSQIAIFDAQKRYLTSSESVSILSAFPLFLFDYFPKDRLLEYRK